VRLTLQTYPSTLQEHNTILNSVPYAYFRVSLRDCAIHSSRWVDFANFGLVGFHFFVRLVKMMRAFVCETTARLPVCSGVRKAVLRDVRTDILFSPYGHHVPS
jgi:hypothetical protein